MATSAYTAAHLVEFGPDRIERQVHLAMLQQQQIDDAIGEQSAVGLHLQLAAMMGNQGEHTGDLSRNSARAVP